MSSTITEIDPKPLKKDICPICKSGDSCKNITKHIDKWQINNHNQHDKKKKE